MAKTQIKSDRLHVRLTNAQRERTDRAAAAQGRTVAEFTVTAMEEKAEWVLADRRLFELAEDVWTELEASLDRPVQHKPALEELFARPTVFTEEM